MAEEPIAESREFLEEFNSIDELTRPSWQELYADDQLRITFKGEANREQREQVDLAAKLISKILSGNG